MFQNNLLMAAASAAGGGGLTVDNSVRYNDDDSPRLYRTPTVAGNRRTGSLSLWYKRGNLGSIQQLFNAGAGDDITFNASDKLTFADSSGVSYITTQVFRDPAAWGHLVFAWDTTISSPINRLHIYHNGTQITAFDTETNPSLGDELEISNTVRQTIGANESDTEELDGYLSQVQYIDGEQLLPTSFGEFDDNGVWRPIEYAATSVGSDVTLTATGEAVDATGATTYTTSDVNIGTVTANRKVVIIVTANYAGTKTVSTITVGGESAYPVASSVNGGRATEIWAIDDSDQTLGTSEDIITTWSGATVGQGLCTFDVKGAGQGVFDIFNSNADPITGTLGVPAGGCIIGSFGVGIGADPSEGFTFTSGLTERFNFKTEASEYGAAGADVFAAAATQTITIDIDGSAVEPNGVCISFSPVGGNGYSGDVVPVMTGATSPSGEVTVTSTYTTYDGYKAFDKQPWASSNAGWINNGTGAAFIAYEFTSSKTITMYTIMSRNAGESPEDWTFDGWNGSAWVELDAVTGENWTAAGQTKVYKFTNTTAYIKYRLNVTLVQTDATEYCAVMNLTMHEASSGYSTNGFLLDFADSSDFGNDVSGNNNDYTSSGLAANDQVTDTPTKNYPTFASNGGRYYSGSYTDQATVSNGNLDILGGSSSYNSFDVNFTPLNSGKWYFTWDHDTWYNANNDMGIVNEDCRAGINGTPSWAYASVSGSVLVGLEVTTKYNIQSQDFSMSTVTIPVTATTSDQTVMAVDIDNLKLWAGFWDESEDDLYWLANDGTWSTANVDVPATGSDETCAIIGTGFTFYSFNYSTSRGGSVDFGAVNGGLLANITQPSGFNQINTANLPEPAILDGTANFQTTLYTGNATDRNISQTGNSVFTPDWAWIKNRTASDEHKLIDITRGVGQELSSDSTAAEGTDLDGLQAFSDKLWIDASGETKIGNMTAQGGLAASWDGDNSKGYAACSGATTTGYSGIDWGSGNTKTITQMITIGSNDYGYSSDTETITITIEGSTDNFSSSVVDLGGGTGSFANVTSPLQFKLITPTSTTAYRYHRAKVVTSSGGCYFAQVQFFEANTGDARGFTLGNGPAGYNDNSENFVAWQWLAGGGAGSSNEAGSINTTTTTVNTTSGCSLSTYTGNGSSGATLGHGLGAVPKFVITKERDPGGHDWIIYHAGNTSAPETEMLAFSNAATSDFAGAWNDTAPTSTLVTLGNSAAHNESGKTCLMYAFAEVEGFSKFGGFEGNGEDDGTYVYTGFTPAWVMIKRADATGNWVIYDNQRSTYNEIDDQLLANTTGAETTGSEEVDFLSNGFKNRTSDNDVNAAAGNYVYAAFAAYPFGGGEDVTPATTF